MTCPVPVATLASVRIRSARSFIKVSWRDLSFRRNRSLHPLDAEQCLQASCFDRTPAVLPDTGAYPVSFQHLGNLPDLVRLIYADPYAETGELCDVTIRPRFQPPAEEARYPAKRTLHRDCRKNGDAEPCPVQHVRLESP